MPENGSWKRRSYKIQDWLHNLQVRNPPMFSRLAAVHVQVLNPVFEPEPGMSSVMKPNPAVIVARSSGGNVMGTAKFPPLPRKLSNLDTLPL